MPLCDKISILVQEYGHLIFKKVKNNKIYREVIHIFKKMHKKQLTGAKHPPYSKAWANSQVFKDFWNIIRVGAIRIIFQRSGTLTEET